MASYVTVVFNGRNGLGSISIPGYLEGTFGSERKSSNKVLLVQKIEKGSFIVTNASGSFSEVTFNGQIDQTTSDDFSNDVFVAVIEV